MEDNKNLIVQNLHPGDLYLQELGKAVTNLTKSTPTSGSGGLFYGDGDFNKRMDMIKEINKSALEAIKIIHDNNKL